jgi:hypothetical protein
LQEVIAMRRVRFSVFVVLALLFLALPAFSSELTVTFTAGDQSLTLVDENNSGTIRFSFGLNGLDALGSVVQRDDGNREDLLFGRRIDVPLASHLTNTTAQPLDVVITVTSRAASSAITSRLELDYAGRARDANDPEAAVQVPQHGVQVWIDEPSGSPVLAVDGPPIDAPSGTIEWDESASVTEATALGFVVQWTMTLGPSDEILLGQTVRLARACPNEPSGAPWRRGENPVAVSETKGGAGAGIGTPCALTTSTNGSCANYRWYNVCSGYIWIYGDWGCGEAVGVQFGGAEQPCVAPGNVVKRAITYYRNVLPGYGSVDVHVDADDGDGCPDVTLASDLDLEPALRWNCSEFDVCIPSEFLIVRTSHDGGGSPSFATDGPFTEPCNPNVAPRSYYYGVDGDACVLWQGPTGRNDNFLYWLVVDSGDCSTTTESTSWGRLKGLYR